MSNYGSMPPPGPYVSPTQSAPTPGYTAQQQQGYQQPGASNHGQMHKAPGAFGQMMNQAVTTGKPMLNKLSKTISSKLGSKPSAGPPQHLQSYQNYQDHQGQQSQQSQGYQQQQTYSPPPQQQSGPAYVSQQQQWQPQSQANAYALAQHSPYQQSTYATPVSGHSGLNNYFPPTPQPPVTQGLHSPQQPPDQRYSNVPTVQGGGAWEQQAQPQLGHVAHVPGSQGQPHGHVQQDQQHQNNFGNQQMGVVGSEQVSASHQNMSSVYSQTTQPSPIAPEAPSQPSAQPQWSYPQEKPPYAGAQQHHQAESGPTIPETQQQNWPPMSPVTSHGSQGHVSPPSVSPPPQPVNVQPQVPPNKPPHEQPPTAAAQHVAPVSAPTGFIAELPAEMSGMKLSESLQGQASATQTPAYQAYHPQVQAESPSASYKIPRRAVSASGLPVADPWRFADATTELPTREFFILADLLFDALDRKVEPRNTGLLEGPKILGSWVDLTEDAHRLFSHNGYTALARMWSLEGIPHIMVPVQLGLCPKWNFSQQAHAQDVKVIVEIPGSASAYATYMPALNRSGWYKFFFLEMMHGPDDIGKLMQALCADMYKPGVLNHPDITKRDRSEMPALQARAAKVQSVAMKRVCDEARAAMAIL